MPRAKTNTEAMLHDQTNLLPRKKLLIVFTFLAVSLLISFIDQSGVTVILPTIAREFHAENTISWAGTSSLIASTVFQVLYGRFSDLFGRKIVFVSAILLLSFAVLMCSLSNSATMFYVFRGLAGVANGGLTSLTMMIVSDIVTLEERGKYQGILGAMVGLGNVLGPVLGATFAERATWRALFYLLSPANVLCAVLSFFVLPSNKPTHNLRDTIRMIDFAGLLAGSVAVIFLLIPISGGGAYFAWSSPLVISMLTIGSLSLASFLIIEWRFAKLPMMPLYLWRNPAVAAMLFQNFFFGAVYYSYLYYLPFFYLNALGYSPMRSALMGIPLVLTQATVSSVSGFCVSYFGTYGSIIYTGFFVWTLGSSLLILFSPTFPLAGMIVILILIGIGAGEVFQPSLIAMQAHCTLSQRAVITSNRNFLRSLGGAVGLACSAAVLQSGLKNALPDALKYLATSTYSKPDFSHFSAQEHAQVVNAYVKASRSVFIMLAPFMGVCMLACMFIRDRGLKRPDEDGTADEKSQTAETHMESSDSRRESDLEISSGRDSRDGLEEKDKDSD